MEEFAKMIYREWSNRTDENEEGNCASIDWGDYQEKIQRLYDFLNRDIASELEYEINNKVYLVQENAFIAGFGYACKCLSNGRIEIGGGVNNG